MEIRAHPNDVQYYRNGPWSPFVVADGLRNPDILVCVQYGELPDLVSGPPSYDSGGIWQLYRRRDRGGWVVNFRYIEDDTVYKVAAFNQSIGRLDVYIADPASRVPDTYPLDFPLDELLFSEYLILHGGLELHCSAVSYRGQGLLFCGVSGTGKSTISRLWQGVPETIILSDDRAIVRREGKRLVIYGTPWHGEARISSPGAAQLHHLYFLRHGPENRFLPLTPAEAAKRCTVVAVGPFWSVAGVEGILDFVSAIVWEVPCTELIFRPDREVVGMICNLLSD